MRLVHRLLGILLGFSLSFISINASAAQDDAARIQSVIAHTQSAIKPNAKQLFSAPDSIVVGNAKSAITIVEFLDYLCPYCKAQAPILEDMIKNNPDLRVVFKQYPIHGEVAEFAAKAVIAAALQGKFFDFNQALLAYQDELTVAMTLTIAKKIGLNLNQLRSDMKSTKVTSHLARDLALASSLKIKVTPTLIVANVTAGQVPVVKKAVVSLGQLSDEELQGLIDKVKS